MPSNNWFSVVLDQLVHPNISLGNRSLPAFHVCGCAGLACTFLVAFILVAVRDLSPYLGAAIALLAVVVFLAIALITKVLTGTETLTYYTQMSGILLATALLLYLLGQPILPYLDVTAMGIGTFMVFGRIGCLMAGCCHGKPARWGVRYNQAHVAAGFPNCYAGLRLMPIQAIESGWMLLIVLAGCTMMLGNARSGSVFAWYLVSYNLGRFWFEFVRGDSVRPYYGSFSQAQWIAVILTWCVVAAELLGILPFQLWHVGAAIVLSIVMLAVALLGDTRFGFRYRLWHPYHIKQMAEAVALPAHSLDANKRSNHINVVCTSLGIQISSSIDKQFAVKQYTISARDGKMSEEMAEAIAELIHRLHVPTNSRTCIKGSSGIFHILIR